MTVVTGVYFLLAPSQSNAAVLVLTPRVTLLFCPCSNNTLWGSLMEPDIVDTELFEELFSKATQQPKKKPLSDTFQKKTKAKKVV